MIGLEVQINCNSHRCWGWVAQISWLSNVEMWIRILKFWCSTGHFLAYTPENCHGALKIVKNHPFAKEKASSKPPIFAFLVNFPGCTPDARNTSHETAVFFCLGFPSLGRGVSEFPNGNRGLLFHQFVFFPLRRNQLVMLEPSPPHPPKKRVKIGLFNHITIFSNLRAGSKRPIRWYQNQGGYSDVPLGCKKKSSIAKAFCRLQSLKCCRWFPSQGGFTDASMFLGQKVVRQGRSSGQTASWFQDAQSWPWLLQFFCCFRSCDEVRCVNCG